MKMITTKNRVDACMPCLLLFAWMDNAAQTHELTKPQCTICTLLALVLTKLKNERWSSSSSWLEQLTQVNCVVHANSQSACMYWNGRRIRRWLWWSSSVFLQGFFIAYFTSNILIILLYVYFVCRERDDDEDEQWMDWICTMYFRTNRYAPTKVQQKEKKLQRKRRRKRYIIIGWRFLYILWLLSSLLTTYLFLPVIQAKQDRMMIIYMFC